MPVFSLDGSRIAFKSIRDRESGIYKMELASKKLKRLTDGRSDTELARAPDGNRLLFLSVSAAGTTSVRSLDHQREWFRAPCDCRTRAGALVVARRA